MEVSIKLDKIWLDILNTFSCVYTQIRQSAVPPTDAASILTSHDKLIYRFKNSFTDWDFDHADPAFFYPVVK